MTCSMAQTHNSQLSMLALRTSTCRSARRVPSAAAATCAGGNNTTYYCPPETSVSRRRWRSTGTDADAPSRNFSGLMPSSDGSWAWQNWGLPHLLVNVPKGEKERETEKCRGASPVTQMPTILQILNMFGQRWYLLAPPRSVKSDNPHPNIPIVFSPVSYFLLSSYRL